MIETISAFDSHVLQFFFVSRDPLLTQLFIWISELGRAMTIYGLAACILLVLALRRHYAYAAGLALSATMSGVLVVIIKGLIERARPAMEFQAYSEIWYSFPSGHAALSAAFYGFLAYSAWKLLPPLWEKIVAAAILVLIAAVGFSRIYLGVHYVSDVVAGLLIGFFCAWLGSQLVAFAHKT